MFGSSQHILFIPMEWEKIPKSMGPREVLRLSFRNEEPAKETKRNMNDAEGKIQRIWDLGVRVNKVYEESHLHQVPFTGHV